jgi:uncharacterized protein YjbI with pentapeptide repeats
VSPNVCLRLSRISAFVIYVSECCVVIFLFKFVRRQSVLLVSAGATLPEVLNQVNLSNVDFKGRDFRNQNLSGVNLSGANLSGANLSGANLSRANMSDANLTGQPIASFFCSFHSRVWHFECCHLLLATIHSYHLTKPLPRP